MNSPLSRATEHQPRLLLAFDKFRGSASARELTTALEHTLSERGFALDSQPLSDGGEGFRDAFDGDVVDVVVPGPLGDEVSAPLVLHASRRGLMAVFTVAEVVGHDARRGLSAREALAARSDGVGHVILEAHRRGATSVLVGCGGSSSSDGGLGCYEVLRRAGGLPLPVTAACDVTTNFLGARRFASQKGVASSNLDEIDRRLGELRTRYLLECQRDVNTIVGAGAAGGIAGALAALGASVVNGFEVVADAVKLGPRVRDATLVVSGEGRFDWGSLEGKVTVKVAELVTRRESLLLVCGGVDDGAAAAFRERFGGASLVSLEQRYGVDAARRDVTTCVQRSVEDFLVARRF